MDDLSPIFLTRKEHQERDAAFVKLLDTIRLGLIDDNMKHFLTERAAAFKLQDQVSMTTYVYSVAKKGNYKN